MNMTDVILRLGSALLIGVALGLEREKRGRAAGLRTTTLVAFSASLAMILSEWLPSARAVMGSFGGDPARLAAGVLTGMGFLGAGVIIRQDTLIRGVTTAAVLWTACILGLTAGSGNLGLAWGATIVVLMVLLLLPWLERRMDNDGYVTLTITMTAPGVPMTRLSQLLTAHRLVVLTTSLDRHDESIIVCVHISAPKRDSLDLPATVTQELRALPGITRVTWAG
jgi:putative Mg2+ transporter-C (MgtC) family protein